MKKFSTNRFYKGINTDLSFLERQGDVLLDALNVRLTSINTDGLFAANIKGNVEEFSLKLNFKPIGSVEYNGVLYILSVNEITNQSEIGTFPSPKTDGAGGFERVYRPLRNYTTDNPNNYVDPCTGDEPPEIERKDFTTELLNFNCNHQCRVLARLTFDKSVNLYWTDNFNPLRSINVGFNNETGVYNNKYTSQIMIETGQINVISENDFIPIVELDKIDDNGFFDGGHYFFFIRYLDIEFNTTSFLSSSKPIPVFNTQNQESTYSSIYPNSNGVNTQGPIAYGTEEEKATNKSITLNISNLDSGAGFVEFAYIYYKSQTEFVIKLLDKRFPLNPTSSLLQVTLLGNESKFDISLDELVTFKPTDSLYCKDIAQIDNKLYIANTRGIQLDNPDLRKFFCSIRIGEDNSLEKSVEHFSDTFPPPPNPFAKEYPNTHALDNPYGIDEKDVHENVGYFSGETYCFAGVPILKGGFASIAFPLKGVDNVKLTAADENFNGIYRFSDAETTNNFSSNIVKIKGVTFDMTNAITVYNNSTYLQENLIGLYFCRTDRNKNLLYQGLAVPTYTGGELARMPFKNFEFDKLAGGLATIGQYKNYFSVVPLIERSAPYIYNVYTLFDLTTEVGKTSYQKFVVDNYYDEPASYDPFDEYVRKDRETLGIFSFDFMIDDGTETSQINSSSYIKKIGEIEDADWLSRAPKKTINPTGTPTQFTNTFISVKYPDDVDATIENFPVGKNKMFLQENMKYLSDTDTKGGGFTADTYGIPLWDAVGVNIKGRQHATKIPEGSVSQGLYYKKFDRQDEANDETIMNLPIALPAYIAVDLQSSIPTNTDITKWHNTIVNVYRQNPDDVGFDYTSLYDFKNLFFSPITDFIPIQNVTNLQNITNRVFYQGDCFHTRSYIKLLNKFDDSLGDEILDVIAKGQSGTDLGSGGTQDEKYFFNNISYLLGLSIVTENQYNPNYRYTKGRNLFYPKETKFFNPAFNITNSPEANFYNKGYTRMLSPRQFIGLDKFKPVSDNSFPTRIRPSFKHILNSLKDGYLQFTPGVFQDYDFQYGPINALMAYNDQLFSFQDDAINLHPINERAVAQSSGTDTPFILGESRELTEFKRALSVQYGTQHQWSIVKGESGIYGFDWNKNVFWRVSGQGFQDLGLIKGCQKWIEDIVLSEGKTVSDITEQLPDNPVCNQGIHSVYDRKYKEVVVTFIFGEDKNQTISYSEKGDLFGAKYSFTPVFYSELENDLYSFSDGKFWRHDANDDYDNFYGVQDPAFVEVVVNPDGEIAKHFDNIILSTNNVDFDSITYQTQHQSAEQNPFLGEFWNRAVYREFQWKLPIRRADNIIDNNLSLGVVQSRMRGRYLIVNLKYVNSDYMWIREIITAYTQSKA